MQVIHDSIWLSRKSSLKPIIVFIVCFRITEKQQLTYNSLQSHSPAWRGRINFVPRYTETQKKREKERRVILTRPIPSMGVKEEILMCIHMNLLTFLYEQLHFSLLL